MIVGDGTMTGFNPRARVGRDPHTVSSYYSSGDSFNPRARVGRDGSLAGPEALSSLSFNPRARVGRDRPKSI